MDLWIMFLLGFLISATYRTISGETEIARSLDISAQWQPVLGQTALGTGQGVFHGNPALHSSGTHMLQSAPNAMQASMQSRLISVPSFDTTNQLQLAQIARHNAQILRHIKGLNPPVTQYKNPFPVFHKPHQANPVFNFVNPSQNVGHHMHASGSSVSQTIIPSSFIKHTFITGKPTFIGKKDFGNPQFFNGIHTSTAKIPTLMKSVPVLKQVTKFPNHHAHDPVFFRDVTLTPPPQPSPSMSRPHAVINHIPHHQPNSFSFPTNNGFSSYAYFGPSAHLIREKQPKLAPPPRFNLPLDSHFNLRGSAGFHSNNEQYIPKANLLQQNDFQDKLVPIRPSGGFTPLKEAFTPSFSSSTTLAPATEPPNQDAIKPVNEVQDDFIPPNVLIPSFLQQIQQEPNPPKVINSTNNFNGFSYITDDFSKNLVPPPFNHLDSTIFRSTSTLSPLTPSPTPSFDQIKSINILNKYNIPAESPLQDVNKFKYAQDEERHNFFSVSTTVSPLSFSTLKIPLGSNNGFDTFLTTEKPDIFKNLKRPVDNTYKEHKLMHPAYTGARHPNDVKPSQSSAFLPTPINDRRPEHTFFTVEDAITMAPPPQVVRTSPAPTPRFKTTPMPSEAPEPELVDYAQEHENFLQNHFPELSNEGLAQNFETTTSTTISPPIRIPMIEDPAPAPPRTRTRNKMRRRRPRPNAERLVPSVENEVVPTTMQTYMTMRRPQGPRNNVRMSSTVMAVTDRNMMQHKPHRMRRPHHRGRTTTPAPWKEEVHTTKRGTLPKENTDFYSTKSTHSMRFGTTSTANSPTSEAETSEPEVTTHKNLVITLLKETTKHSDPEPTPLSTRGPTRTRTVATTTTSQPHEEQHTARTQIRTTISSSKAPPTHSVPDTTTFTETQFETENEASAESTTELHSLTRVNNKQIPTELVVSTASVNTDRGHMQIRNRHRLKYKSQSTISTELQDITEEETTKRKESSTPAKEEIANIEPEIITTKLKTTESTMKTTHLKPINRPEPSKTRPRFSVKDYRLRLKTQNSTSTTTTTTDHPPELSSTSSYNRHRFPTRRRLLPQLKTRTTSTTEAPISAENIEPVASSSSIETHRTSADLSTESSSENTFRKPHRSYASRSTSTTVPPAPSSSTTPRRGVNTRRDFANRSRYTTSTTTQPSTSTTESAPIRNVTLRRPPVLSLKERIQNYYKKKDENPSDANSIFDDLVNITMDTKNNDESITESSKMESAIMKIAKDDHTYRSQTTQQATSTDPAILHVTDDLSNDLKQSSSEYSQRVADLTVSGSTNSFQTVNGNMLSRRIPGYFTLATDDPILPIEAFFTNVNRDRKSRKRS